MEARLKNPVMLIPGALQALLALDKSTETAEVPYVTRKLIHLRAATNLHFADPIEVPHASSMP